MMIMGVGGVEQSKKVGEIELILNEVDTTVGDLERSAHHFHDMVTRILRPVPEELAVALTPTKAAHTDLGRRLVDLHRRLQDMTEFLDSLPERVEL
jgi:hypothetical protein